MHWIFTIVKDKMNHFLPKSIFDSLKHGWKLRRVCFYTSTARTRERFVRTKLGSFWIGLSNLISISLLSLVYTTVFKIENMKNYTLYLGIGIVIWNALSTSISSASNLLIQNEQKIKNTNIHPIFYSVEEWLFQIQSFFQSFSLIIITLSILKLMLIPNLIIFGILPLLNFIIFIYWFPLLVCLIGVKFRDIYQLVPIMLQLIFLLSPILYMKENLGNLEWIINLNPIYLILDHIRDAILFGEIKIESILIVFLFNICGLYISIGSLNKSRKFLPFLL